MESLLSLPPELRLLIFEAIIATPRVTTKDEIKEAIKGTIHLAPSGRPRLPPLARTCRQLHHEFSPVYMKSAPDNALLIKARIYNFDFTNIHHLLELKPLNVESASEDRRITIEIILTAPQMTLFARASLAHWYEHCEKAGTQGSRRTYSTRVCSRAGLSKADLMVIRPTSIDHYDGVVLANNVRFVVLPFCPSLMSDPEVVEWAASIWSRRAQMLGRMEM
ncbi:hypothetical protein LTR17_000412 [Elasticomyces elasticus]|nr:hypothetical protein LTR17_000412 [Elasticomyces elasticus]